MRAVVMSEYGGPECLQLGDLPDPRAASGWKVVRLHAAALNWHDVLVRKGQYGSPLPHVPGADGSGVDAETGESVVVLPSLWWGADESAPGGQWEILGDHRQGTYAELVRVPAESVYPAPSGLSWAQSAALPLVGVTTYRALFSRGRLKAGESLLVLGAGGGVATMAVSIAAAIGCTVVVTSSSEEKIRLAESLGASGGVLYTEDDWPSAARELSPDGSGFDLVLDSVGTWQSSVSAVRPGGRVVVLGASRADLATLEVRPFYFGQYDLLGTTMGSPRDFADFLTLVKTHAVPPPVVDRCFPLDRAAEAHAYLESGAGFGKVILEQV
ncbi:MAG: NADPH:quinone reductase [Marmoricola sp.]|nr:NADPH:quinone reductase [Marmoricola sp.]